MRLIAWELVLILTLYGPVAAQSIAIPGGANPHAIGGGGSGFTIYQAVQGTGDAGGNSTTLLTTFMTQPTVGHFVVGFCSWNDGTSTYTDNYGNTYTQALDTGVARYGYRMYIWTAPITNTGAGFTTSCQSTVSHTYTNGAMLEVSSISAVDATAFHSDYGSSISCGSVTTTSSNGLVVAYDNYGWNAAGTDYILLAPTALMYRITTATGTYTPNGTISGIGGYLCATVALK